MAHTADHALLDVLVDAVVDNAPDIAVEMRKEEWRAERDPARLEQMLIDSGDDRARRRHEPLSDGPLTWSVRMKKTP